MIGLTCYLSIMVRLSRPRQREAIAIGRMDDALEAINYLQSVPLSITRQPGSAARFGLPGAAPAASEQRTAGM